MELTEEQLSKIFELASLDGRLKGQEITSDDITEALIEIERKLYSFSAGIQINELENKRVLIADDLELSIYQLSTVLRKIGVVPSIARHKEEAISEINKINFDCIIIDLYIPDSDDGLDLIRAAVKKRTDNNQSSSIIVISGTDDKSLIDKCYDLGADFYIQKDKNWHSKLLKYLSTTFQTDSNDYFTKFVVNNNTVSYSIKRFNDPKIFDLIKKNITSSIYTGLNNVIFDLKEISTFDSDDAYIFADIYKICAENKGSFILVKPSMGIKEALSFAYLEDIIQYADTVENAVSIIYNEINSQ